MENNRIDKMRDLIVKLNEASEAYYAKDAEIMSNYEYDALYDELCRLEEETGTVFSDSPTQNVGFEAVEGLPHEDHASPMLSLDKTKEVSGIESFAGDKKILISWKMDGLTIVLTYNNGELVKGVTRGNGKTGEVITGNVRTFKNIPLKIAYKGELVIRGEAVISYSDFEKINDSIEDESKKYKNPRNLCSGSVRQLDSSVTAKRNVRFYAFSLVSAGGEELFNSVEEQFRWLKEQGFETVEYRAATRDTVAEVIEDFKGRVALNDLPSDGLVAIYDDIAYGRSLGMTAKFPRNSIAFKWKDETAETVLRNVEWSASRTGLINPIAVFDPVELEGTTVSRASVHNVSMVKALKLGIGDRIRVYKANMIIPQISENITASASLALPDICPVCGTGTILKKDGSEDGTETLYCPNPDCPAKKIQSFVLFVSRDALNIEGLSESTLEKFISMGIIHELGDIFALEEHKDKITSAEGFGEKSFNNLKEEIDKKKHTTLTRLICGLGIPNVGLTNAGTLCRHFGNDPGKLADASFEELKEIDTIGPVIAGSVYEWFHNEEKKKILNNVLKYVKLEDNASDGDDLQGVTFVITGSLEHFNNRSALKELITGRGGKVASAVSKNTDFLINNDSASASSKNRKASELGIPVITEEEFIRRFNAEVK